MMSDRQQTFEKVAELIEPFNKKGVTLSDATTFQGDLEWDSLTVMDFVAAIEDATGENFASYIAQGEQHCIIPYSNFYDAQVGDVRLTDWLRDMLDGPVASVSCEGEDCEAPTPGEQGLED